MSPLTVSKSDITRVLDAMSLPWTCVAAAEDGSLILDIPTGRQNEFFYVAHQVLGEALAWKLVIKRQRGTFRVERMHFPSVQLDEAA